jgi:hypothetical protein
LLTIATAPAISNPAPAIAPFTPEVAPKQAKIRSAARKAARKGTVIEYRSERPAARISHHDFLLAKAATIAIIANTDKSNTSGLSRGKIGAGC